MTTITPIMAAATTGPMDITVITAGAWAGLHGVTVAMAGPDATGTVKGYIEIVRPAS